MLKIGEHVFQSRLLLGTGKFDDLEVQSQAIEASGTEVLTFAVRRLNLEERNKKHFLDMVDLDRYTLLPNTAGASTAEEAVRIAELARASGLCDMIKVEVIGDGITLLPDPIETYKACEMLLHKGFTVLPYISDDVILAKRLQLLGVHAVMPGASPIGSGRGIMNPYNLEVIIEQAVVPVVVDAGLRSPSDAARAMEMGADAVLLNTAVSGSGYPADMAKAMRHGVEAGRLAYEAGMIPVKRYAAASSPAEGMVHT